MPQELIVIFQRKTYLRVKKKNVKNISWGKYVQARAFWRNGSYAPDENYQENVDDQKICKILQIRNAFAFWLV